ncbi:MAG: hypothetical protein A2Z99_08210 [Treponema sp. GWB1_62_6]|nr:MAG: hypothetical protein A2Z99_08210 [Treponema sp. GWB1_62_6]
MLRNDLHPVWEAWQTLTLSRPIIGTGFGAAPGPIPFEAIDRYAERFRWTGDGDFEDLLAMLRALDAEYLKHTAEKAPEKPNKKGKTSKGNRKRDPE